MKWIKNGIDLVRILLGIVFLSAAVYRLFNYDAGINELSGFSVEFLLIPMIILELSIGILLLINKGVRLAAITASIFLILAIVMGFVNNGKNIVSNLGELFVFNANPTDILLHIIYLAVLIFLFKKYKK